MPSSSAFNRPSDGTFALLTPYLILLPSPSAAAVKPYRTLFRKLHADAAFCAVAFGEDFEPIVWSDEEVKKFLLERDAATRWMRSGMGDFAVGSLEGPGSGWFEGVKGEDVLSVGGEEVKIVRGEEFEELRRDFENEEAVKWVGYTCVRNAVTAGGHISDYYTNPPPRITLSPEEEMVEVRYGMDPDFRGRGIATRAAEIAMTWAAERMGVRRFVAETQRGNGKSQGLLRKLGFVQSELRLGFTEGGGDDEDVVEWVRPVIV